MLKILLSNTPKLECLLKQKGNHESRVLKAHDKFNFDI